MQLMGIMLATNSALCLHNLETKSRLVTLFQLHVGFLILGDHVMLQVPSSTPTELCDHNITVAKEVDVEGGMRTWLKVRSVWFKLTPR